MAGHSAVIVLAAVTVTTSALHGTQTPRGAEPVPGPWHIAVEWSDSNASGPSVHDAIVAELTLGNADRAEELLLRHGDRLDPGQRLEVAARVAGLRAEWLSAAHAFTAAALLGDSGAIGRRLARAGDAFERAGRLDSAVANYRRARSLLPAVGGWLAVREARLLEDTVRAESLLVLAPPAAWRPALQIRARQRLLLGDPASAESLLEAGGMAGQAAELALARGDTGAAVRYALAAVRASDTAEVRRGVALFAEELPPTRPAEAMAAAHGAAALRDARSAAAFAALAVQLGDSTPATLVAWGEWLERAGRRRDALRAYTLAGDSGAFHLARARLRLGDRQRAAAALRQIATRQPDDAHAPVALYLAAEALGSERLLRQLIAQWPNAPTASQARMRLAQARLDARDTAAAIPFLEDEVAQRGAGSERARYLLGRAQLAVRDREAGRLTFAALAHDDSLGYYGALAREVIGGPPPAVAPAPDRTPSPQVQGWLEQLTLLDDLGFRAEARTLVTSLLQRRWDDAYEMLDVAAGLVASGRGGEPIRLGYAAAQRLGLNDPSVLRAVFPWPNRTVVEAEAGVWKLDPYLVAGLIRQESWFTPAAHSRAGAVGYMQLMPATAREVARRAGIAWTDTLLTVPDANVHIGCRHLATLLSRYGGDVVTALAAYNAGPRPAARWRRRARADDPVGFVERITYPETRAYVRAVVRNRILYRLLYPPETQH